MLNYGYAVLHANLKLKLISEGYDPKIGLAHATEKYRDALVLDHMEPLRPLVDREILRLVLDNTMNPGDFTISNEGFCRLNPQLARKVVAVTSMLLSGYLKDH
jgi:CRISP-associated protein Cas1